MKFDENICVPADRKTGHIKMKNKNFTPKKVLGWTVLLQKVRNLWPSRYAEKQRKLKNTFFIKQHYPFTPQLPNISKIYLIFSSLLQLNQTNKMLSSYFYSKWPYISGKVNFSAEKRFQSKAYPSPENFTPTKLVKFMTFRMFAKNAFFT